MGHKKTNSSKTSKKAISRKLNLLLELLLPLSPAEINSLIALAKQHKISGQGQPSLGVNSKSLSANEPLNPANDFAPAEKPTLPVDEITTKSISPVQENQIESEPEGWNVIRLLLFILNSFTDPHQAKRFNQQIAVSRMRAFKHSQGGTHKKNKFFILVVILLFFIFFARVSIIIIKLLFTEKIVLYFVKSLFALLKSMVIVLYTP